MNPYTKPTQARLPQTSKSIFDYTEEELNQIDEFQNRNRGFEDDDRDIPLENDFDYFEYLD